MTASASRPPRPGVTTYRTMTAVTQVAPTSFVVRSVPHPIHSAYVYRTGGPGTVWRVEFHTIDIPRSWVYASMEAALNAAGELVGRKAGQEWKERFTGPQRYAMGQQQCPRLMGPGMGVCGQSPEVGSIWCRWHPKGREVRG